jgi:protocatechuate 3,4-dioxygenase beta subunit
VAPGASIAGRVTDGAGKPVAGTEVMASQRTDGERTMIMNGRITSGVHGLTDATGAYKLVGLSPGSFRVTALDRGKPLRLHKPAPTVELAANEDKTGVDLVVDRANGVIQGTVTGPDGAPLADAWVSLHQDMLSMLGAGDEARRPGPGAPEPRMMVVEARDTGGAADDSALPPALTDAQGHYEIRGLPHATFTVTAEAQRGQLRARATDIKPDATVDLRALGVTTLEGKVTGPNGPVALFSVELEGPTRTQRSFTDGAYSFTRVDPGTYTVNVQSSDGNGQASVAVAPNQPTALDIALAANAIVTGKLVDATGRPVADQAITLIADSGDERLEIRIEGVAPTTAADGSFRLEQRAGRFALVVLRSPPFIKRGLALSAGKTFDLGTVALDAPGPDAGPGGGAGSGAPSGSPRRRIAEAR